MKTILLTSIVFLAACSEINPATSNLNGTVLNLGNEVGNGGDAIRCPVSSGSQVKRTQLLDFYEAISMSHMQPILGGSDLDIYEKADLALNRIKILDPTRYATLKGYLDSFDSEKIIDDFIMEDINDSGYVYRRDGCSTVTQLAEQREPQSSLDSRYIIQQKVWEQLDPNNRAGLILHEIIYRDALRRGHPNSIGVRKFTGAIASSWFENISQEDYDKLLFDLHLNEYVNVPSDTYAYHNYFRYFDIELKYREAKEFCQKLPGMTFLGAAAGHPNQFIGDNAMMKHILGDDFTNNVILWEADENQRELPENNLWEGSNLSNPRKFVCRVVMPN
jgi:hypothetical protein